MKNLKSNIERAKSARVFMIIMAVISGLLMLVDRYRLYFVHTIIEGTSSASFEEVERFDTLYASVHILGVAMTLVSAIFFIMWFRRAYYNLHQLTSGLQYSEGWAAGAWFVPIFNWFAPYQIASDLFKETEGLLLSKELIESNPKRHKVKAWWWGLWIAGSIIGNFDTESSIDLFYASSVAAIISGILLTLAGVFAARLVVMYHQMEVKLKNLDGVSHATSDQNDLLDA
jgi:hypothetical protein